MEQKAHNEASLQRKVDRQEEADKGQMVKAAAQAEWLTKLRCHKQIAAEQANRGKRHI